MLFAVSPSGPNQKPSGITYRYVLSSHIRAEYIYSGYVLVCAPSRQLFTEYKEIGAIQRVEYEPIDNHKKLGI